MCGGGGSKSQTVYQAQLPGPLTDRMAMAADAAYALGSTPFKSYEGPRVAGLNTTQYDAMGQAGLLAKYQAPTAQVRDASTTDATATTGQATDMQAAQIRAPGGWSIEGKDLSGYTNPWEDEVVRTSMSGIDAELARAQQQASGNAAMAGAWGGSSAGIEQAALASDALRTRAATIAGLRSSGYARAQDLASADITRGLSLAQAQAGLEQEANATNAGAANQFGLANMQAQNQFGLTNKAAQDQFALANSEAWNRASLADQQASLAAAGVRTAGVQQQWGMGSAEQSVTQAGYDVGYDEFLRYINDPFQKTQFAIGALTGVSPNFATSSTTSRTPSPNPWSQAAGVAAIGAGLASFAHGGEVGGGLGYMGGGTLPSRRDAVAPAANDDEPADPEIARLLAELAVQDLEAGIDPAAAAPRLPQAGLAAPRPPMSDAEGRGEWAAPPAAAPRPAAAQGDVRLSLAMPDQERPDAAAARQAGIPVDASGAPRVAGLAPVQAAAAPLPMAEPQAYSVPPEGVGTYRSSDPVIQQRYALESGGNPAAMNTRTGAVGLGQYRPDRLVDLGVYQPAEGESWSQNGRATRATWAGRFQIPGFPEVRTVQDLQRSPEAQAEIERRNEAWERQQIQALGLDRYIGRNIAGLEVTDADLRHAIHFAGPTGAARFFGSGGQHNPTDGNMRVDQYIARMRAGAEGPRMQSVSARVPQAGIGGGGGGMTVPAAGAVQTPVEGAAEAGRGIEGQDQGGERPGWWDRVRAGFRDPAGAEASGPMALIAAGLGMLGSRSPHFGTAVGEGGLMGLQSLTQARQQRGRDAAQTATARYRDRMAGAAEARARAAESARRDGRLGQGYMWDPANPGRQTFIPGGPADPANQRGPESRVLSPEEAEAAGFRPGSVVTVDRDPRTGRESAPVVRQQPRERQIPQGWEEDPERPGAIRRQRGYQEDRPLPPASVTALSEVGTRLQTLGRLRDTFKPEYGGKGSEFTGSVTNWIGRNVGAGYHEQAQWWQDYQGFINEVRNSLFGAALTATEAQQFNRFSVNPGMTARTIRQNLARQQEIARTGALRQGAGLIGSGYNPEPVATALGLSIDELEAARARRAPPGDAVPAAAGDRGARRPQPSGGGGNAGGAGSPGGDVRPPSRAADPAAAANDQIPRVSTEAEVRRLAPGSRFVGPDGRVRVVPERAAAGGR